MNNEKLLLNLVLTAYTSSRFVGNDLSLRDAALCLLEMEGTYDKIFENKLHEKHNTSFEEVQNENSWFNCQISECEDEINVIEENIKERASAAIQSEQPFNIHSLKLHTSAEVSTNLNNLKIVSGQVDRVFNEADQLESKRLTDLAFQFIRFTQSTNSKLRVNEYPEEERIWLKDQLLSLGENHTELDALQLVKRQARKNKIFKYSMLNFKNVPNACSHFKNDLLKNGEAVTKSRIRELVTETPIEYVNNVHPDKIEGHITTWFSNQKNNGREIPE